MADSEVEEARRRLRLLGRELVELDRRLLASSRRSTRLRAALDGDTRTLGSEERRLSELPEADRIDVEGSVVSVTTRPLVLEHDGRRFRLGRYRLELDLGGDVRVHSLDRLGAKPLWDHPHVQMGIPCLGNVREGVLKLVAELELASAARVLLDFLQIYHPPTAYGPVELWPAE